MTDCIFCNIADGQIPATIVYRDNKVVAFKDIHPQTPVHILVIPVKHMASLLDATEGDTSLLGHMVVIGKKLAEQEHVAERGYRLLFNTGPEGGQVVKHVHMHVLGGRELTGELG